MTWAPFVHLCPRSDSLAVSPDVVSLVAEHGLFAHETRMLSRCRWTVDGGTVDGEALAPVALSAVEPHTWATTSARHPGSLTATTGERSADTLTSLLPGK